MNLTGVDGIEIMLDKDGKPAKMIKPRRNVPGKSSFDTKRVADGGKAKPKNKNKFKKFK